VINYPTKWGRVKNPPLTEARIPTPSERKGKRDPECMDDDDVSASSDDDSSISKADIKDIVQTILLETMHTHA
jgi:hypothetical protein